MKNNINELRQICQRKDCPQRIVSIYFTRFFLKTKITPDQITIIDYVFGLIGAVFLFFGTDFYFILGGIFLQLFEIFDCVDGEVARYNKKKDNAVSDFFQDLIHPLLHPLIFMGFGFGLFRVFNNEIILILSFLAAIGAYLDTYVNTLREKLLLSSSMQASRVYKQMKKNAENITKRLPFGKYILEIIIFPVHIPGIVTVILLSSILDYLIFGSDYTILYSFNINFKFVVLIFYAITQQLFWFFNAKISIDILKNEFNTDFDWKVKQ